MTVVRTETFDKKQPTTGERSAIARLEHHVAALSAEVVRRQEQAAPRRADPPPKMMRQGRLLVPRPRAPEPTYHPGVGEPKYFKRGTRINPRPNVGAPAPLDAGFAITDQQVADELERAERALQAAYADAELADLAAHVAEQQRSLEAAFEAEEAASRQKRFEQWRKQRGQ